MDPHDQLLSHDHLRVIHGKIDADGDGKMSMAEIKDFALRLRHENAKKSNLTGIDTDEDGKLTLAEVLAQVEAEESARHADELQLWQLGDHPEHDPATHFSDVVGERLAADLRHRRETTQHHFEL